MEVVVGCVQKFVDELHHLGQLPSRTNEHGQGRAPHARENGAPEQLLSLICVGSSSSATVKSGDRVCIPHSQNVRLDENRKEMDGEDMGRCPVAAEM